MKQAILITAYRHLDQLKQIIDYFDDNYTFYIHIDKQSQLDWTSLQAVEGKKVSVYQKYVVRWGGVNHLKAILFLAGEALKDNENTYFHLISGQDFPAKSLDYFAAGFDRTKDYIRINPLPRPEWPQNGGLDRIDYYNPYDCVNAKKIVRWMNLLVRIQKALHFKRAYPAGFPKLYGGSTWWSLTRETLQYVMDYTQNTPSTLQRMNYTFCSEELYFQTVIQNSSRKLQVVDDNLRYIDWVSCRGGRPAFLDESDFQKIVESDALFARKFTPEIMKRFGKFLIPK
ncbi:MAG: beta-1,6-N-acetylglucosaminyltransferase [Dysgonamonadaceae bacterium]|jgi:hypothetical protein|nr:beta-1,6-N-acetylglucosaminyltransferase [Dysgonamonadaceae bacterium]